MFKWYLTDFLVPGVLFPLINIVGNICLPRKQHLFHSIPFLMAVILLASFIWEFVYPFIFHYGTSDIKDVYAYIGGTFFYWAFILIYNALGRFTPLK